MLRNSKWMLVVAAVAFAAGCKGEPGKDGALGQAGPAGPTGEQGDQGVQGPQGEPGTTGASGATGATGTTGEQGIPGPITAPPEISGVSPMWGSGNTEITLTGTNFGATAGDNKVFFNGMPATVLSASATKLVVQSGQSVGQEQGAAVSVEVANQVSNAMAFMLVPAGTLKMEEIALPTAPTGAVAVGTDLYVAGGTYSSPAAGLYKRDSTGKVTRVWAAKHVEWFDSYSMTTKRVYDTPVALATDGTDVFFTSAHGHVRKYLPAAGVVVEVMAPQYTGNGGDGSVFPPLAGIAVDSSRNVLVAARKMDVGEGMWPAVVQIAPDGEMIVYPAWGWDELWGIAVDGTKVYVTGSGFQSPSLKVLDLADSLPNFVDINQTLNSPRGIAFRGGSLYVSLASGTVVSMLPDGTNLADYAPLSYQADQITVSAEGLLLAQPAGSAVRRVSETASPELLVVGARPSLGSVQVAGAWYFAAVGPAILNNSGNGPANLNMSDSAVLAVMPDGASKVVFTGKFFSGLAATADGTKLAVPDCLASVISSVDLATGGATTIVDSTDGLLCPGNVAYTSAGDLLYTNLDMSAQPGPTVVGKVSGATKTPSFITGLPPMALFLALSANELLVATAPGRPGEIYSANMTAGGAASLAVSPTRVGEIMTIGAAADGRVFVMRSGNELMEYMDGELVPFTYAIPGSLSSSGGGSGTLSLGFRADDTVVYLDTFGVWAIAP
ncbi:MAG TPA: IPT/TIG domain-containing protein [Myxococcales bacterium]|jgi:hypothetical protein